MGEEEEEEEDDQTVGLALHGSLGPKYNGQSDLFYSQFELHTREEKMIQLVLIKVGNFCVEVFLFVWCVCMCMCVCVCVCVCEKHLVFIKKRFAIY